MPSRASVRFPKGPPPAGGGGATTARKRRLEPACKRCSIIDDGRGVVLDVELTTVELNLGDQLLDRLDAAAATTGFAIKLAIADAGHAHAPRPALRRPCLAAPDRARGAR